MASADQRSISGSHSIPFSRDDAFQDMTAFTPPPESWLIRYPKSTSTNNQTSSKKEVVENQTSNINNTNSNINKKKIFTVPEADQLDDTCKRYIESSEIPVKSNKSLGTDDHFKSAVCSKNLLKVCEKLMTKKEFSAVDDDFDAELSLMNEQSRMEFYRKKYGNRRDSQSLPASPKMERKNQTAVSHNPYFTVTKQQDSKPDSSISFLTNLFGITARNPKETQVSLAQKYEATNVTTTNNGTNSNDSMFNGGGDKHQQPQQQTGRHMTPRPHPYREMNIFSPTSM